MFLPVAKASPAVCCKSSPIRLPLTCIIVVGCGLSTAIGFRNLGQLKKLTAARNANEKQRDLRNKVQILSYPLSFVLKCFRVFSDTFSCRGKIRIIQIDVQ